MDPHQFESFVLAWGAALTTLVSVMLALALAVRSALAKVFSLHGQVATDVLRLQARVDRHAEMLNGVVKSAREEA